MEICCASNTRGRFSAFLWFIDIPSHNPKADAGCPAGLSKGNAITVASLPALPRRYPANPPISRDAEL